ncbi:MAG: hypothetical protein AAF557_28235 [Pseudomonadota bacterium]
MRTVLALTLAALVVPVAAPAQVDTEQAQGLLREAVVEAFQSVDCVAVYTSDFLITAFYNKMDAIAEKKFEAAGLDFPTSTEDRDTAYLPVFGALYDEGLIIEEQGGDVERFPSACEG